jgi:hypothetical protein
MSLSPFVSFQSRFVTYLLTFPHKCFTFHLDICQLSQENICMITHSSAMVYPPAANMGGVTPQNENAVLI